MLAIWKREVRAYFTNVTGWIFIGAFLFLFNLYFYVYNLSYGYPYVAYPLSSVTFIFLILVPVLTMRILAEDRRQKTDQMLFTSPVSVVKIVISKFLSMVTIFSVVMGVVCLCPLFLSVFGTVPMAESYVAILGTWLFGVLSIAVGLFVSSLTENQVISAILTFAFLFLGYMMDSICGLISSEGNLLTKVLNCLSTTAYVDNFFAGVFDIKGLIYFLSGSALFIFLTCQVLQKYRWSASVKKLKAGVFSSTFIILGIAVTVGVNLVAAQLPASISNLDVTYNNIYSLTDDTKDFLKDLDEDVTIYVLSGESGKDTTLDQTLKQYEAASSHIKVEYVDPVVSPQFYSTYTDTEPTQNSMIVVNGDRSKVIDYNSIYESSMDYETYSYNTSGYDGEGQLTSAIQYVINDEMPKVYVITGHGEASLDSSFQDALEKQNVEVQELNLLECDKISEDTAGIIINGPSSDFSKDDAQKVTDYLASGGKALITTNYAAQSDMSNFDSVLAAYDIQVEPGVVMEGSGQHYYQYPFYLLPDIQSADATASIDGYIFFPDGQALTNTKKHEDKLEWTPLLNTSDSAYIKENVQEIRTYEKEEGDPQGQYTLAASVSDNETGAEVTVISSPYVFTSDMDSMVSGNNLKLFSNITGTFQSEESGGISIPVKSYTVGNLTVNRNAAVACSVLLVIVIPVALVAIGIFVWARRRKK